MVLEPLSGTCKEEWWIRTGGRVRDEGGTGLMMGGASPCLEFGGGTGYGVA